jgi:hypothetical protein
MRRSALLLLVFLGCGGRDPLYGVSEEPTTPPVSGPDASVSPGTGGSPAMGGNPGTGAQGGSAGTGGTTGTKPPPSPPPDAAVPPPPVLRDAGVPVRDAAPPPNACQFPKCVAALFADCMPTGKCVQQRSMGGGGISSNVCYGNGVKLVTSVMGGRNATTAIKVFKADGTLCYTVEPEQRGGGVNAVLYRDASGQAVASATVDRNTLAVACTGTTTPQSVATSCQPGLQGSTNGCGNGMCM